MVEHLAGLPAAVGRQTPLPLARLDYLALAEHHVQPVEHRAVL